MTESGSAREWWRAGAVLGAVVAFVLGVIGLAIAPGTLSPSDVVYGVLQLFVLADDRIGSPPANVLLEVARFLAPATTAYAVFEALRALLSGELRRRRLARRRGHTIVCGDDVAATLLASTIGATALRRVVLVGTAAGNPDPNIDTVHGDPRDVATLRRAGISGATALFACAAAPDVNAAVVLAAAQEHSPAAGHRFQAYAEVGDDELVGALRVRQLSTQQNPGTAIDFFSLEDTAARAVIADAGLAAADPVVIVGDGEFGTALLRALVRLATPDGVRRRVAVHTAGPDAVRETATHLGVDEHGIDLDVRGMGDPITEPAARVFVSRRGEDVTISLAIRLARTSGHHVVACLRRAAPFDAALGSAPGLRIIGVLDEACRPDRIAADAVIGRAARAIHRRYVEERAAAGDSPTVNPSMADWEDLPAHLQESNYAQAEHIGEKLRTIHAVLTTVAPAEAFAYRPGEIDTLARLEHKRWMDERTAARYVWGPSRVGRHHPDLVDWPDLSQESRQKDIDVITYLPRLLAGAGLYIARTTA